MKLTFSSKACANYLYWQKTDKSMITRINRLINDIQREPYTGIGKLEPLKHSLAITVVVTTKGFLPICSVSNPCPKYHSVCCWKIPINTATVSFTAYC